VCVVPALTAGSYSVSVTVNGSDWAAAATPLVVTGTSAWLRCHVDRVAAPVITAVSPASVPATLPFMLAVAGGPFVATPTVGCRVGEVGGTATVVNASAVLCSALVLSGGSRAVSVTLDGTHWVAVTVNVTVVGAWWRQSATPLTRDQTRL
jgi:hypothetical protein